MSSRQTPKTEQQTGKEIRLSLLRKGSVGIFDEDTDDLLSKVDSRKALNFLRDGPADKKFMESYDRWLFSHKSFAIEGLDKNEFQPYIIMGTTQSFHDFYHIHHDRILKIRRGEYPYHKVFFNSINRKWGWIDDEGVNPNDFVILSRPFSGNGNDGEEIKETLDLCNKHNVPVLLDCAFWGLSESSFFHLKDYPCIRIISFSLSKFFNAGRLRIGMMYSRHREQASGAILSPYHYINGWSAYIGCQLINHFSINYMNQKYRNIQKSLCKSLNITPSETLLFGLGKGKEWEDFHRDDKFNRICLSKAISEDYKKRSL